MDPAELTKSQRKILFFCFKKHQEYGFDLFVPLHSGNFQKNTLKGDKERLHALGLLQYSNSYRVNHRPKSYRLTPLGVEVASDIEPQEFEESRKAHNVVTVSVPDAAFKKAQELACDVEPRKTKRAQQKQHQRAQERSREALEALNEIKNLGVVTERRKHRQCRGGSLIASLPDEVILELLIDGSPCSIHDISACYALTLYHGARNAIGECDEIQRLGQWLDQGVFYENTVGRERKKTLWCVFNDWAHRNTYDDYRDVLQRFQDALPEVADWLSSELNIDKRFFHNISTKLEASIRNEVYRLSRQQSIPLLNKHDSFICPENRSKELVSIVHEAIKLNCSVMGYVKSCSRQCD